MVCFFDFIFLIRISSCKDVNATIVSILCKEEFLPMTLSAILILAYDFIL